MALVVGRGPGGRLEMTDGLSRLKSYVIVTHFQVDGGPQELARYIQTLPDCGSLTIISHPLEPRGGSAHTFSRMLPFVSGRSSQIQRSARCFGNGVPEFIWTVILTLYWLMYHRIDVAFGANCLNVLPLIMLKKIGYVDKVVYYCIDFVPKRFENYILNNIYHLVEKFAVEKADVVWNLSSAMVAGREARGYPVELKAKQITVPIGIYFEPEKLSGARCVNNHLFVYVGMLVRKQGIFEIIDAFSRVAYYFPDSRLRLIGDGIDRMELERRVDELGLGSRVEFCGMVTDRKKVVELLREGSVGLAPYRTASNNFSHFADPTKFKDYLMAGLPIIFTRVSVFAEKLIDSRSGILVRDHYRSISDAMLLFTMFPEYRLKCAMNGRSLAIEAQWINIFSEAFNDLRLRKKT